MDYYLYHDESKVKGYWHGMLLVPVQSKETLVNLLERARGATGYKDPVSLKKLNRKRGQKYLCYSQWAQIAKYGLVSDLRGTIYRISIGGEMIELTNPLGLKFMLLRERDNLTEMGEEYPDHASKVETTLRFGLKGGMHYLGSEDNPIHLEKLHFDGHEHYHRHVDPDRVIGRMKDDLREYCTISERRDFIEDRTSDHRKSESQPYPDCQLIQLTDLITGSFRVGYGYSGNEAQRQVATPLNELRREYTKGIARMRNSRWADALSLSQCYLENGEWDFEQIPVKIQGAQLVFPF